MLIPLATKQHCQNLKSAAFQTFSQHTQDFLLTSPLEHQAFHQCQAQTVEFQLSQCDLYKLL